MVQATAKSQSAGSGDGIADLVEEQLAELASLGYRPCEFVVGQVYLIQEALGYLLGRVLATTPAAIQMDKHCVWVRDAGQMRDFYARGTAVDAHPQPYRVIERQAIRYYGPPPANYRHGA